jgi:hypothetical protein
MGRGAVQNIKEVLAYAVTLDISGAPGKNRTCGTWIRNPMLYPLSYGGRRGKGCEKKNCAKHLSPQ